MPKTKPLIGFDRFVRWDWVEYAFELAYQNQPLSRLKEYIYAEISGRDSARKTYNMLANLWFENYPNTKDFRERAFALFPDLSDREHLVLHWGMALVNFPFFYQTVTTIGRLIRLQGEFQTQEIRTRVNELYSNQNSIPRAVHRVIQTLTEWNVFSAESPKNVLRPVQEITLTSAQTINWLLETMMIENPGRQWRVIDLLRAPTLFPFNLEAEGMKAIRYHDTFAFSKDTYGDEILWLK